MKRLLLPIVILVMIVGPSAAFASRSPKPVQHGKGRLAVVSPAAHVLITQKGNVYAFTPHKIIIRRGTTVIWTNDSDAQHTVTAASSRWTSAPFDPHKTYKRRFTKVGTVRYFCAFHGYMTGVIVIRNR